MRQALDEGKIVIVAGFQGIDENYNITTLGRGGSDTTAVALAAVMKHDPGRPRHEVGCEIYTDVDGVYTTDPRIVPEARKIDAISYDEMLELASVGAGVMHSRSIEFAKKFDVPLQVRSSFSDVEGTWIVPEADWMRDVVVCGAAIVRDEARISPRRRAGRARRQPPRLLGDRRPEHRRGHDRPERRQRRAGVHRLHGAWRTSCRPRWPCCGRWPRSWAPRSSTSEQVSKVSIVGTGMRTHTGVAERMFAALAAENINMKMITTGDIKISVLVDKADGVKALRAVHQAFELGRAAARRRRAGRPAGKRRV